ncbi:MAG: alpha/beta fold hydrolase [Peptococcaceae bacterium]|nr:alpha/beta fold hydrolase [Peptococcaceae bacterium]
MPTFPSADHRTTIHYHAWLPETTPRAVLVLFHGMLEYSGRYEPFANALNAQGIAVYAQDHLGHGESVHPASQHGHFADTNGNRFVINDCLHMLSIAHAAHPQAPLFLMGHSMGSFLARQLRHQFSLPALSGVILMGSGKQPRLAVKAAQAFTAAIAKQAGIEHKSPLLFKLILGGNNRRCHPRRNSYDWLSRDPDRTDAFASDKRNCDNFTAQAYNDMLTGMLTNYDARRTSTIDTSVPLLILSGDADPIGEYGKGIIRLRDDFLALGCNDVRVILYPGARHELLNEINRDQVTRDILDWLNALL